MKTLLLRILICVMVILGMAGDNVAQINLPEVIINRPVGLTKVIAVFKVMYKEAREPHWYYRGDRYAVTFLMDDLKYNVLFKKDGQLIYQIRYGNESNIPQKFKPIVAGKFHRYSIISAINYQQDGKNLWLLTGEGEKDFLHVKIEEGKIVEEKRTLKLSIR